MTLMDKDTFVALTKFRVPFNNEEDYSLVEWFVESKAPATYVDVSFKTTTGQKVAESVSFSYNFKLH